MLSGCGGSPTSGAVAIVSLATATAAVPTPAPTPPLGTWLEGLHNAPAGDPVLLSCLDADGDLRLTGDDDARFDGLDLPLDPAKSCTNARTHADFFADDAPVDCDANTRAMLLVVVGGGGTDLLQAKDGESVGLLTVLNEARPRIEDRGTPVRFILAAPAIFGGVPAQGTMERYLTAEIGRRLDASPCLDLAIIGHSHGGVTVTAVTAALEDRYAGRMLGVLVDRSAVLYDGDPDAIPATTPILNVFQLNEGWHGTAVDRPNYTNVDESPAYAPFAPSDGSSGMGRVSHKTLDDASDAQAHIMTAIVAFAAR